MAGFRRARPLFELLTSPLTMPSGTVMIPFMPLQVDEPEPKSCELCDTLYMPAVRVRGRARFCSDPCRMESWRRLNKPEHIWKPVYRKETKWDSLKDSSTN